jgi:hypothetical protein
MRQGQSPVLAYSLHAGSRREMLRGVRERQELHNGMFQGCTMNVYQALAFMLELTSRTFSMVYMVAMCVVPADNTEAHAVLDEHKRWFDRQFAEIETQQMIDELFE